MMCFFNIGTSYRRCCHSLLDADVVQVMARMLIATEVPCKRAMLLFSAGPCNCNWDI
jgi:hypothetical protein